MRDKTGQTPAVQDTAVQDTVAQQAHPVGPSARRRRSRRALLACAALAVGALTLTACGGAAKADGEGDTGGSGDGKGSARTSGPAITISAKDGSTGASINSTGVKVSGGRLTEVTMTESGGGTSVPGKISASGTSWQPAAQLERGTAYRISAKAEDSAGHTSSADSRFTTVTVANSFIGTYTPDGGTTVGVGMPVSFTFDKAITDKKAVQSGIEVTSNSGQQVVGHWFGAQRLDFRPESYWKAGSKVTMKIHLDGVAGANGVHGVQNKTVTFTIGRSQVSTVDVNTQTMTVVRDGRTIRTVPISAGSAAHPTYNGQMVISSKATQTRMKGSTVGFGGEYDIPDVPHAMRLTTSGTFIHGNYWYARGNPPFGRQGTSHGCVGLQDAQGAQGDTTGKWFYDQSMIGDVVTVKNSPDSSVAPDNGLNGWNMSWSAWKAGSAV